MRTIIAEHRTSLVLARRNRGGQVAPLRLSSGVGLVSQHCRDCRHHEPVWHWSLLDRGKVRPPRVWGEQRGGGEPATVGLPSPSLLAGIVLHTRTHARTHTHTHTHTNKHKHTRVNINRFCLHACVDVRARACACVRVQRDVSPRLSIQNM